MNKEIKADDVIFNFFQQICDEKDNPKCIELGNSWINAMETNLTNMEKNLKETDKVKHQENIDSNKQHLNSLKDKTANEWREYATQCMVEILDHKTKS
jgi:Skp family chaperone for outer membrane proteins